MQTVPGVAWSDGPYALFPRRCDSKGSGPFEYLPMLVEDPPGRRRVQRHPHVGLTRTHYGAIQPVIEQEVASSEPFNTRHERKSRMYERLGNRRQNPRHQNQPVRNPMQRISLQRNPLERNRLRGGGLRGRWRATFGMTVTVVVIAVCGMIVAFASVVSQYRTAARHLEATATRMLSASEVSEGASNLGGSGTDAARVAALRADQLSAHNGSLLLASADQRQNMVMGLLATVFTFVIGILTYLNLRVTKDMLDPFESLQEATTGLRDTLYRDGIQLHTGSKQLSEIGDVVHVLNAMAERVMTAELTTTRDSYDSLTGLANRVTFISKLTDRLALTGSEGVAVILVELDNFDDIKTAHGQSPADAVLAVAATRLLSCVRTDDLVARLGAATFAILVGSTDSPGARALGDPAARVAQRVALSFDQAFELSSTAGDGADPDGYLRIFASIRLGVGRGSREAVNSEQLLAEADALLRSEPGSRTTGHASKSHLNSVSLFSEPIEAVSLS